METLEVGYKVQSVGADRCVIVQQLLFSTVVLSRAERVFRISPMLEQRFGRKLILAVKFLGWLTDSSSQLRSVRLLTAAKAFLVSAVHHDGETNRSDGESLSGKTTAHTVKLKYELRDK